jgi:hypothetical protein
MASFLRALCKSLIATAGPAGAIAELALNLYDDEQAEKLNMALVAKISEKREFTKQAIEEIFEIKGEHSELYNQLVIGFRAILNMLVKEQNEFKTFLLEHEAHTDELASVITKLIRHHQDRLTKEGFITEQALIDELTYLYSDVKQFQSIVSAAGFPEGVLTLGTPPRNGYLNFVKACWRLTQKQQADIFAALATNRPESYVLNTMSSLLMEMDTLKGKSSFIGYREIEKSVDTSPGRLFIDVSDNISAEDLGSLLKAISDLHKFLDLEQPSVELVRIGQ